MSIKAVHIFFILVSMILAFGFGYWSLREGGTLNMSMGVGALAAGGFLLFYLKWFIQKIRKGL